MTNIWKRSLSMFMAIVMVFGMMPLNAFATTVECEHANTSETTVPATCTENGSVTVTCTDCNTVISTEEIIAAGHTPGEAATCVTAQTCTVCGAELVAATGVHTFAEDATQEKCNVCEAVNPNYIVPEQDPEPEQEPAPEQDPAPEQEPAPVNEPEVTYVAEVGDDKYTDIQEAIVAAAPDGTVTLLDNVTVDEWIMFAEELNISSGDIITLNIDGLTIDGDGHELNIEDIESAGNGGYLFYDASNLNVKDLTINVADGLTGGIGLKSGKVENVTFNGGWYGVLPGNGEVIVENCTFNGMIKNAVYFDTARDNLTVTGNTFNTASGAYAIIMYGAETFTGNTISTGRVNLANTASGTVSGNDFGNERFKVYNGATATISGNTINNLVFNDTTEAKATFTNNDLSESAQNALDAVAPAPAPKAVAKVGETPYETLSDALAAANAGATITFVADITEDVTVTKAVTIDGAGKTYTGKMILKADTTIKNVNFDGKGYNGYAVETRGANYLTIEDCTAKNYGYGFVQLASATALTTVKNVTVSNMNYGVKVDYSNAVVLENVDITAAVAAVLNSNYGEKTITIKDSELNILGTWRRNNTTKTNYVFEGANTIDSFITEAAIDNFKLAAGATLTAPEAITVTTVEGYEVKYENGTHTSVAKVNDVVKIGEQGYETLADALAAANAGDTVEMLADVTLGEMLTITGNVTISGEKTITRAASYTGTLFTVNAGATLTLDGGLVIDGGNAWTYTKTPLDMDMVNGPGTKVADHITPAEGGVNATAHMIVNKGTLNVNNVTIQNSYSTNGVSMIDAGASSVTTINGATIQNIAANRSGAVAYIGGNDATLTIKGETKIAGNFGISNGGIIQNYGQGTTVNLEGGRIENNHIGNSGTLYASYSNNGNKINTFNMSGGVITNNIMEGYGPVYIHTNTVWNMTGGEISNNTSLIPSYVRNASCSATISGGKILNNVAVYGGYENMQDIRLRNDNCTITGGTFTQDVSQWLADDYGMTYNTETGKYEVAYDHTYGKVVKVGEIYYKTLQAAIDAANAGDTVTFLEDITENVTINKNLTIDGGNFKYTGKMTGNKNLTVTVQNVNFVNGGFEKPKAQKSTNGTYTFQNCTFDGEGTFAYPLRFYGAKDVIVKDCTVTNYLYSFLYIVSGTDKVSVNNVTVEGCPNYAVYFASGVNTATFENLTVKGANNGFIINNTANRAFTIKNCQMVNVGTAIKHADGDKNITCTVLGNENDFGTAASSQYTMYILAAGATLTAPEGLNVTTDVEDMKVEYENGAYQLVKASVAKIGKVEYASLQEAVDAATAGATITLIADAEGPGVVIDKNLTIDFRTFTYTLTEGVGSTGTESNGFQILKGNTVVLRNGTLKVADSAADKFYILIQNYANLTVSSMTLDGTNLDKWSKTDGDSYVVSNNSGTFNANSETKLIVNNDGNKAFAIDACDKSSWGYELPVVTVSATKNIYTDKDTKAEKPYQYIEAAAYSGNKYYATLQQAVNQGGTITMFRDVTGAGVVINKNVNINFGGFTYTLTEGVGSTGTESNGFQILKGNTVVLRNGTLKVADSAADKFYILVQNYAADLSMSSMTLDGTYLDKWSKTDGDSYTLSNNSGNVTIGANTKIIANNEGALAFAFDACDKSAWGYELPVVTVNTKATIQGNVEAAAKIGNVYYATLQQAINAAKNGGTITLVNDIDLANETTVLLDGSYNTYFKVEGKSITIDLNGKKISGNYAGDKMLVGVFSTENGGHLTLTGNGTVDVTATGTVYALFANYEAGCSITVENGTYTLDKAGDSLIYSGADAGENEGVTVKGGTFTLGNVGTGSNGKPWIFNCLGSNVRNVIVSGGTYNFNVNAQYWAHEVDVVDANGNLSYVVDNKNGTWTVTGNTAEAAIMTDVAGNYDYPIGYATLADALAAAKAGQAVLLMKDIKLEKSVAITGNRNVVIDLNGHTMSSAKAHVVTCYYSKTTITIKDSVGGGKVLTTGSGKHAFVIQSNLVIDGAEISSDKGGNAIVAQTNNANVTIQNDAVINGKLVVKAGKLTITGGTFENKLEISDGVTVAISAGYFKYPVKAEWCAEGCVPTEKLENGYYSVVNDPSIGMTAKIGDDYYETLADAIAAAKDGDTITLLADIALADQTPVLLDNAYNTYFKVEGKSITIDLNGNNISGKYTDTTKMLVGVFSTDNGGHLTLTGAGTVDVTTGEGATVYSLIVNYEDGCSITVKNGTYTLDKAGDSLIYSGSDEDITVEGGIFTLNNVGTGKNGMPWIFNAKGQNTANIIVMGGSFNADILHQYYPFEVQMSETLALKNENGIYTVVPAVAYVTEREWTSKWYTNNVGYATLEEAIAACEGPKTRSGKTSDQEEVVLLKDIALESTVTINNGKTVVLNLNGKTISMEDASGATAALLENRGDLTITGEGKLTFKTTTPSAANAYASNTISNYGVLTIENGTIENTSVGGGACYALDNYAGSTATINGGKLSAEKTAVRIFNWTNGEAAKAVLNVNGGEILSNAGYGINFNMGNAPTVELNVTGGTITTNDDTYNLAAYIVSKGSAENVTIHVTGGTFNGNFALNGKTCTTMAEGKIAIQGGTFNGIVCYDDPAYGFLTGGNYVEKPEAAYLAEGYMTVAEEDGTYSVEKDPTYGMTAKIGDNYYETLAAAIAAAEDGDTITLLADIAVDTTATVNNSGGYATIYNVAEKAITINLNGKKIDVTVNAADVANATNAMLLGVFAVDTNGSLTLTGNGFVTANAVDASLTSDDSHLYSLMVAYGAGGKLVVENGTYTANSVSASLVYSQYDEVITINGGTFNLGNVGTDKNGSPWIFNAKGQNTANILVNGGSYPVDIQHQYYPFEVQMPETLALSKDENGIYTVVPAVAYVTEREWSSNWYTNNVGYATLEEAFAAAEGPKTRSGKTSVQEEVHILSADIKDIQIPAGFEGKLVLENATLNSVSAADKADIEIRGNVKVENKNGSAISGKVLNISGDGSLTAIAGDVNGAFGIGGMDATSINIEGITITEVIGAFDGQIGTDTKYYKDAPEGGAAIGSGYDGAVITLKNVHIVEAVGGSKAAGIGARYHTGVTVNIEGCTIDSVVGGATAAAIGSSRVSGDASESDTTITITGSTITAVGGVYGAGIGSGYDTHCQAGQPICTINIDGSTINATGGQYAAGVGTGYHNAGLAGEIKNSTVNARSGDKLYKDIYTQAQDIGFGVVDPTREGVNNNSSITVNGTVISIPEVG